MIDGESQEIVGQEIDLEVVTLETDQIAGGQGQGVGGQDLEVEDQDLGVEGRGQMIGNLILVDMVEQGQDQIVGVIHHHHHHLGQVQVHPDILDQSPGTFILFCNGILY